MNGMKLMVEELDNIATLVEEKEGSPKRWFIEGTWMQSNILNRNKRFYPKEIMSREVARYVSERIDESRAVGELGHPDGPTINQDRISHKILSLKEDGDNFVGKALVLNTPMGRTVQALLEDGVRIGVSSRGMGSLKENSRGIMEVQQDFYLATAGDIVHDPSAPSAFVNGIMEGVEWYWDNGSLKAAKAAEEVVEAVEQEAATVRGLTEGHLLRVFNRYIASI